MSRPTSRRATPGRSTTRWSRACASTAGTASRRRGRGDGRARRPRRGALVNAAATAAAAHTGRVSLSPRLVAVIADELSELPGAEPWRSEVLRRAATFQRALRDGAVAAVIAAAASLAGLGEVSTPAGDDYLVGALHALTGGDPIAAASQPVASALGI